MRALAASRHAGVGCGIGWALTDGGGQLSLRGRRKVASRCTTLRRRATPAAPSSCWTRARASITATPRAGRRCTRRRRRSSRRGAAGGGRRRCCWTAGRTGPSGTRCAITRTRADPNFLKLCYRLAHLLADPPAAAAWLAVLILLLGPPSPASLHAQAGATALELLAPGDDAAAAALLAYGARTARFCSTQSPVPAAPLAAFTAPPTTL